MMEIQAIGADIGRGCTKGYTEYRGRAYDCCFGSVRSAGREIEFSKYDNMSDPIYIGYNDRDYFVGELAEKEGDTTIQNLEDDKTLTTVDILLATLLSKIAISDRVVVALGVPHKCYTKKNLTAIEAKYKGKTYKVRDHITASFKEVTIVGITIFREADAALLWHVANHYELGTNDVAMVNVGFRTTELSYYDNIDGELIYNDKRSDTLERGNLTALEQVAKAVKTKRSLHEIDNSSRYDKAKQVAYEDLQDYIQSMIESKWINLDEVDVFSAGGTSLHLNLKYNAVQDAQMATAKGLFEVAKETFEDFMSEADLEDEDAFLEALLNEEEANATE